MSGASERARELAELATARGAMIAAAESCTGGLIAAAMTDIAGSSAWFGGGVVAYTPELKQRLLDVPASLIAREGVVSEGVAAAMAQGALALLPADRLRLAVATTGIAGPGGAEEGKPVGTVMLGWAWAAPGADPVARSRRCRYEGDRQQVRAAAVADALAALLEPLR